MYTHLKHTCICTCTHTYIYKEKQPEKLKLIFISIFSLVNWQEVTYSVERELSLRRSDKTISDPRYCGPRPQQRPLEQKVNRSLADTTGVKQVHPLLPRDHNTSSQRRAVEEVAGGVSWETNQKSLLSLILVESQ